MFCTRCGSELRGQDKFCSECATPTAKLPLTRINTGDRLSRPRYERKIAGVCAGIARYMQVDVTAVRIIAVILLFWPIPFVATIAYLVAWAVIPQDPIALPQVYATRGV